MTRITTIGAWARAFAFAHRFPVTLDECIPKGIVVVDADGVRMHPATDAVPLDPEWWPWTAPAQDTGE